MSIRHLRSNGGGNGLKQIPIQGKKNSERFALVDDKDFASASRYKWYGGKYVYRVCGNTTQTLHRFIMKPSKGLYVDHINRDTYDCRRSNMRVCSPLLSAHNRSARRNKIGYRGVCLSHGKNYCARITIRRKKLHLGVFQTAKEAAVAYDLAALQYFGQYADLNVLPKQRQS